MANSGQMLQKQQPKQMEIRNVYFFNIHLIYVLIARIHLLDDTLNAKLLSLNKNNDQVY